MSISSLAKIKRKKLARKHNIKKDYFTREIDKYILEFIKTKNIEKRNKIFEEKIKKVFVTLVNNLIFVYKASDLEPSSSLRDDCVRFLYTKIDTFDYKKASKAFSYFNVVARNWLFQKFNSNKKDEKKFINMDDTCAVNYIIYKSKEEYDLNENVFFDSNFINYMIESLSNFKFVLRERDRIVLDAILTLLKNPEYVDIYNKKAILLYIKNMTNLNSKQITSSINRLKNEYYELKNKWIENGNLDN